MNCDELRKLLNAYGDGELDAAASLEIESHLRTCEACRQIQKNQAALKQGVRANAPYFKAPAALRQNILAAVRQDEKTQTQKETPRVVRPWQWNTLSAGLAMAASVVLGFFLAMQFHHPSPGGRVADEIAASHVRSLLATHLMDVVSTDQHTVKPWFDGKLDFAPPVNDFKAQGFPLIGGRLDYIGDRTVAVLVYQKAKHVINVFIWPSSAAAQTPEPAAKNGYNMLHWRRAGMEFWAVSDASAEGLDELSGLFSGEFSSPAPAK